jgi:hypothetical protein
MSSGIAPALCVLLVCGCALGASAQLVVPTAPAQNPSKYDPCLPAPTGVNKVSSPART